jgi:sulfoxide reductase catalytic subunit YedY
MHIHKIRGWEMPSSRITPEHVFFNRRQFMAGAGAIAAGLMLPPAIGGAEAAVNPAFADAGRAVTPEEINTTFNNFYEFGSSKRIASAAAALPTKPWTIAVSGLVEKPFEIEFQDLLKQVSLEDRVVRHRCVEAWAMVVPWTGFALKDLVALAKPLSGAKFVRFETFNLPEIAAGQKEGLFGGGYPWPYTEGLTLAEATNDLAFIATGAYGKELPKSMGAPLRLHTPWKYGFKSIKSIVKVEFTDKRPVSFWEQLGPAEYGFWANVNPQVDHPRWSQSQERMLGTDEMFPTQLFNGYGEWVAGLYAGMENEKLYM